MVRDIGDVVRLLGRVADLPTDQQVVSRGCAGDPRPVIQTPALGPVSARPPVTAAGIDQAKRLVCAHRHATGGGDAEAGADREDVAEPALLAQSAQPGAASADLVAGGPGRAEPGVQGASGLGAGDPALGREGVTTDSTSAEPG